MADRKYRILLVEDNPDDAALTKRALAKIEIGNEIHVCRDGVEALEYLFGADHETEHRLDRLPQVVLLDLKMPKVDGHQVLKRIRGDPRTKRLPVVILTSSDLERDMVESYNHGANAYVRKPVEFGEFNEAVKTLGLFWLLVNKTP